MPARLSLAAPLRVRLYCRCVGFILLHLAHNPRHSILVHDVQSGERAAAVVAVAMAVRTSGSVRAAYAEIRTRRDVHVPDETLAELQPIADALIERFALNRRLLSSRGLLGIEHERLLR